MMVVGTRVFVSVEMSVWVLVVHVVVSVFMRVVVGSIIFHFSRSTSISGLICSGSGGSLYLFFLLSMGMG